MSKLGRPKYFLETRIASFLSRVVYHPNGCITYGNLDKNGYARYHNGEKQVFAHRWWWEVNNGEVPEGLVLDHVESKGCIFKSCINLGHLEVVTQKENLKRAGTFERVIDFQLSKTHCPQGHSYSGDNLKLENNGHHRICITCKRKQDRDRKRLNRALNKLH